MSKPSQVRSEVKVIEYPEHRQTEVQVEGDQKSPYRADIKIAPPSSPVAAEIRDSDGDHVLSANSDDPGEVLKAISLYADGGGVVQTSGFFGGIQPDKEGAATVALAAEDLFEDVTLYVNGGEVDPRSITDPIETEPHT